MLKAISAAEKEFICEGCMSNVRSDGRTVDSFRSISIENNVMPHVHGSAKVQLGVSMSVVCSVKLSVVDVVLENKPLLDISTSISPSNLYRNDDRLPNFEGIISERMFNIIGKSNTIDFEKLCIIPNRFQWIVAIELVVLNMNEDPTDLCSIAINTALKCTMVPNHTLIRGESGEYEDFEINSFPSEAYLLPILKPIPICVSIHKVSLASAVICTFLILYSVYSFQTHCIDRHYSCIRLRQ